jgi:hypothetical protein
MDELRTNTQSSDRKCTKDGEHIRDLATKNTISLLVSTSGSIITYNPVKSAHHGCVSKYHTTRPKILRQQIITNQPTNQPTRNVTCLRRLVSDLSPRRPGFAALSVHVGCVVDKNGTGTGLSRSYSGSSVNIIPPWLSTVGGRSSEALSHPIDLNNQPTKEASKQ